MEKNGAKASGDGHFSFSQMIEFASHEELIQAGDVIGSGTVGTGCGTGA